MESPSLEKQYLGVEEILEQRGNRYGKFSGHAELTQGLKDIFWKLVWTRDDITCEADLNKLYTPSMCEALDMIFHKIGRIGNGDPFYDDSWIDIAGYAQLVVDELHEEKK